MTGRQAILTGSGVFHPAQELGNDELIGAYNAWLRQAAEAGLPQDETARPYADDASIVKACGIRRRRVVDKAGILDAVRMRPRLRRRAAAELSLQAEIGGHAARQALQAAGLQAAALDLVIVGATALERAYPAIAIELQQALGAEAAHAFDISAACSSAIFAIATAANAIAAGSADAALVVIPELATAQVDFRDRHSHFIFGDGAAAVVLQAEDAMPGARGFRIVGHALHTRFSNAIRNDFGFLARCYDEPADERLATFRQNGVRVMRDIVPMASRHLLEHLQRLAIPPGDVQRVWLHQANAHINKLVCERLFGRAVDARRAPSILAEHGNLAAAGALAAFHQSHDDLPRGAIGVLCSFGAGYSAGSVVLERLQP